MLLDSDDTGQNYVIKYKELRESIDVEYNQNIIPRCPYVTELCRLKV
jgi:hypothetical protein